MSHLRRRRNPQSLNPYAYARNNPIKYTDPSGHFPALAALASAVIDWGLDAIEAGIGLFMKYSPTSSEEAKKKGNDIINDILGSYVTEATVAGPSSVLLPLDNAIRYSKYADEATEKMERVVRNTSNDFGDITHGIHAFDSLNIGSKNNSVYMGIKDGESVYVGITNNFAKRKYQHSERFDEMIEIIDGQTRRQARSVEQVIIELNHNFQNKINSISPKRDWYNEAVKYGTEMLKGIKF